MYNKTQGKGKGKERKPVGKTKFGKGFKKSRSVLTYRKRYCRFCVEKVEKIDYKDRVLERLISDRGKILSRRFTGTCSKHQRLVAEAIKRARFIAILPYTKL